MKNFRTYDLAISFYHSIQDYSLPTHLKQQLLRAASSIPLNLAEGRGKRTTADQVRFFYIAMGSIRECEAIFDLTKSDLSMEIKQKLNHLAASTYLLIQRAR